jgi:outer membrane protein
MKKLLLIANILLLVAVVVLYVLFFVSKKSNNAESKKIEFIKPDSSKKYVMPIAYVNVDSLLLNYNFSKEENQKLLKKQENSRLTLTQKSHQFQADYTDFQKKLQNNVFGTKERAEQENNRLMKKQQDLQNLEKQLSQELLTEQQKINNQLRDTINVVLAVYNKTKGFHLILSNTMNDNVLYADKQYNITHDIIELLNSRYKKEKE